jgi:DNA polymerase-3 subunit delta
VTLLLFGKERFLKDEALAQLKTKLFRNPSEQELNFQSFRAGEDNVASVIDFLSTAPFLASARMAVLWGVEELSDAETDRLAAAIDRLPATCALVLETSETNTKKNSAVAVLAEKASPKACHTPFDRDLPGWIETRSRKKGLVLERGTASFLIDRAGRDLAVLDGLLEELKLFIHPRVTLTVAEAAKLAPSNPDEDVFRLTDLLLEDRKKEALRALDGLYRSGAKGPEIVSAIASQLERYKKGLASLSSGRPPDEIAEQMRVPRPYRAAFFQSLRRASDGKLRKIQKELLACDTSFKTGLAGERLAIEKFILGI